MSNRDPISRCSVQSPAEARSGVMPRKDAVCFVGWDNQFRVTEWSGGAENVFGYSSEDILGRRGVDLLVPAGQAAAFTAALRSRSAPEWGPRGTAVRLRSGNRATEASSSLAPTAPEDSLESASVDPSSETFKLFDNVAKDGRIVTCEWYNTPLMDRSGSQIGISSLVLDVSGRRHAERALRESETRYRHMLEQVNDVVFEVDTNGCWGYLNPAWTQVTGYAVEDSLGRGFLEVIEPDDRHRALDILTGALRGRFSHDVYEVRIRTKDGECRVVQVRASLLAEGHVRGFIGTLRDITDHKRLEDELAYQAMHDSLTGLPNRTHFMDRVDRSLETIQLSKLLNAVVSINVDNFKVVNDAMGHGAGDRLLIEIAQRLLECIRPGDSVARICGDEFTVLLEDIPSVADVRAVVAKIHESLNRPLVLSGRDLAISVSIGVAIGRGAGETSEALVGNADMAMREAKVSGIVGSILFEPAMRKRAAERWDIEGGLRDALSNGDLALHYQPVVRTDTHTIAELEALIRWRHPRLGLMPPDRFIPIAEETGLIVPLGLWTLRQACRDHRRWARTAGAAEDLIVAVNVSLGQVREPNFVDQLAEILRETETLPRHVKIEITEKVTMFDVESMIDTLLAVRSLGVSIAIDDFGTGYSSIAYLVRLPVDTIKIDQFFVGQLCVRAESAIVIRSIVGMAKSLGITVTCEGVETQEQLAALASIGVDFVQGSLIARPLTAVAALKLLKSGNSVEIPAASRVRSHGNAGAVGALAGAAQRGESLSQKHPRKLLDTPLNIWYI